MKKLALSVFIAVTATLAFGQGSDDAMRKKIIEIAYKYRGVPYVYGAQSPKAFDCSGFVQYVYREASGVELPRSARSFYTAGFPVDKKTAKPGDVFVFDTVGGAPSHVAIYIGEGSIIHAVSAGPTTGVIVSPIPDRYWSPKIIAYRTFFEPAEVAIPPTAPAKPATPAAKPVVSPVATPVVAPKPTATPAKPVVQAKQEEVISDIGVTIPAVKDSFTDKIPTAAGTSVAFTLTNGTGKGGSFTVLFFRIDPKTYKLEQIHEEKVTLADKAAFSLPPYRFDRPGKYRLVVKDSWDYQLFDRAFMVTEPTK